MLSNDGIGYDARAAQGRDKRSPFKVGGRGGAESRKYAVGRLCVISLDNLGHTSSAPFHFQPTSRRTSKTEERFLRSRLTWPIVCSLLYRSLASDGRHLVSSRSNGPIIAVRQELIPKCWAEFHRTRLVLT